MNVLYSGHSGTCIQHEVIGPIPISHQSGVLLVDIKPLDQSVFGPRELAILSMHNEMHAIS